MTHLDAQGPDDGYQLKPEIQDGNIWLKFDGPGHHQYRARLGAGGAIGNIKNAQGQELLSPAFAHEATDRIIQYTWWSESLRNPVSGLPEFEYRYNVTQGGDMAGHFSPVTSVDLMPTGADVWGTPVDNWKAEQQSHFSGGFASLTRYRLVGPGLLLIRRVILVNKVYLDGVERQLGNSYLEAWTPVNRAVYSGYALGVTGDGHPNWWYLAGNNIPFYPNTPVGSTNGYAIAYDVSNQTEGEACGLIFGRKNPEVASPEGVSGHYATVLNSMTWDTGFGILPGVQLDDIQTGDILDTTVVLAFDKGLTPELANVLQTYQQRVPAPKLWKASADHTGDIVLIRERLQSLDPKYGERVGKMAGLIARQEPTPTATPRPTPNPTATPHPTPNPTATPIPTPHPTPNPTATPQPVCPRCKRDTACLSTHEIPCYCRALLEWDHDGRPGEMPKLGGLHPPLDPPA